MDYICIVSARSKRHILALAEFVRKVYKKKCYKSDPIPRIEGKDSDEWMALDLGTIYFVTISWSYLLRNLLIKIIVFHASFLLSNSLICIIDLQVMLHCIFSLKKLGKSMTWKPCGLLDQIMMTKWTKSMMLLIFSRIIAHILKTWNLYHSDTSQNILTMDYH